MRLIETEADIQEGLDSLVAADPRLAPIRQQAGPVPLRRHAPGLAGLCAIVVSQQLSVASAGAIWSRTSARFGPCDPPTLLAAGDADFAACGLSRPKVRTLRAIAAASAEGTLCLESLVGMTAGQAEAHLVAVPGIGPWTAQIYRMFYLGDADAFAPGDLALQEAARIGLGLPARPSAAELDRIAGQWRPWRGVAARLLWAYYRAVKSREGIG